MGKGEGRRPWFVSILGADHKEGGNRSAFCAESKCRIGEGRWIEGEGQCSVSFLHTSGLSTWLMLLVSFVVKGRNKEQK